MTKHFGKADQLVRAQGKAYTLYKKLAWRRICALCCSASHPKKNVVQLLEQANSNAFDITFKRESDMKLFTTIVWMFGSSLLLLSIRSIIYRFFWTMCKMLEYFTIKQLHLPFRSKPPTLYFMVTLEFTFFLVDLRVYLQTPKSPLWINLWMDNDTSERYEWGKA
jgi:hypothetical protein